jgi:repressor LexA
MFKSRIAHLRKEKGYNMKETAAKLNIPYTTYVSYEKGDREPDSEKLILLSNFFECSVDYLIYRSDVRNGATNELTVLTQKYDNIRPIKLKRFPLLGEIACGEPIFAGEEKENFIMADMDISADFCLRAKGDSMINARIYDGDVVFIKEMPIVENGEIAAVIIEDEATLKRVYYYPEKNKLMLVAENPAFEPLVYMNEELNSIRILGKAVYFLSAL